MWINDCSITQDYVLIFCVPSNIGASSFGGYGLKVFWKSGRYRMTQVIHQECRPLLVELQKPTVVRSVVVNFPDFSSGLLWFAFPTDIWGCLKWLSVLCLSWWWAQHAGTHLMDTAVVWNGYSDISRHTVALYIFSMKQLACLTGQSCIHTPQYVISAQRRSQAVRDVFPCWRWWQDHLHVSRNVQAQRLCDWIHGWIVVLAVQHCSAPLTLVLYWQQCCF